MISDIEDITGNLATRFRTGKVNGTFSALEVEKGRANLLQWYKVNRRSLPW